MQLINISLKIALRAYEGKVDKAGREYILHPLRLMAKMDTEQEMSVALLHDVIEDSNISATDLLMAGIPQTIVDAVVCLSKQSGESYVAFIARVKPNPLAKRVKMADIEDNLNVLRLANLKEEDLARIEKYHQAWHFLNSPD